MSNMIRKGEAILSLIPNADFALADEEIIHWGDDRPQPSDSEIQAEITRLQAEYDSKQYQRDRAEAYPPVTDYLDGIVKGDTAQVDKYIADCLAVKAKYPKGGN